jgi:predicted ester cyclase
VLANYGPDMESTATSINRDSFVRMIERYNTGDLDGYLAGYAHDVVVHGYPEGVVGLAGLRAFYTQIAEALDHPQVEIEEAIEQGDIVAARMVMRGRHTGELMNAAPTGRQIAVNVATFVRFADGRVAERWQHGDDLGLLQQLGLVPAG